MRNISLDEKYRVIKDEDRDEIRRRNKEIQKSKYMQKFHINPLSGLLNDPNGFCFYKGRYHLFYQWFPFGGYHGAKNWYHTSSLDLIHWKNEGVALKTDTTYDNRGVYSGNAFIQGDNMYLIYTGNHKDENDIRHPYQIVAEYDSKNYIKHPPFISEHQDYTEHQRDPKIIKYGDVYYLILGAQNKDKKGRLLVYVSDDILGSWVFKGEMRIEGYDDFGYMWECPDIVKIGDRYVFLFSPQGLKSNGYKFNNVFQNGYIIGDIDFDNLTFSPVSSFEELDRGFDFYACQSAFIRDEDMEEVKKTLPSFSKDKVLLCAWMGLPDSSYTTDESEDYSGCLSLSRVLSIEDNKLIQRPVESVYSLKGDIICQDEMNSYDFEIDSPILIEIKDINSTKFSLKIYYDEKNDKGFLVEYDENLLTVKRDGANRINENQGITRVIELEKLNDLQIFIDSSSVEMFINDGQFTSTSRVFPTKNEYMVSFTSVDKVKFSAVKLETSVKNEFAL